jgi:hypothetical protein
MAKVEEKKLGKIQFTPEVLEGFQFEPQSFKIGILPP